MKNVIDIGKMCVGCRSCEQSCPINCIEMIQNKEGFLYPKVNIDNCIECGICLKKCPINNDINKKNCNYIYGVKNKDKISIKKSASGGISDVISRFIIKNGGFVYGAAYDKNFYVRHIEVRNIKECELIQSSKYVQSDIDSTYTRAERKLKEGYMVLFTGTPCQIAGLYTYLGKDYENLITIDLICHGVPSPKFFEKYMYFLEKKYGKIDKFNFRSKDKKGWGTQYQISFNSKKRKIYKVFSLTKYGKGFMNNSSYRESCYMCRYSNMNRVGDLTIGDFWGIEKKYLDFYSKLGVSSVIVNTQKGQSIMNEIKDLIEMVDVKEAEVICRQQNLIKPTIRNPLRDTFYKNIYKDDYIDEIYVGINLKERIKAVLPSNISIFLKHIIK